MDSKPTHHLCPKSHDSWCFCNRSVARGETPPSHTHMKVHFQLKPDQLQQVKDVYTRLTTDVRMIKCLCGWTQNPNESLHSRTWRYCPKHKNTTKTMMDLVVAQIVATYNGGYVASNPSHLLGIPYTNALHKYLENMGNAMNLPPARKMRNKRLQQYMAYTPGTF